MILSRIEPNSDKLDKLYLELIDLYLTLEKERECTDIVQILEQRSTCNYDLALILRKHNNLDLAMEFYRKVLLE